MSLLNKIINLLYRQKYNKILSQISHFRNIEGWLTDKEAYGLYNIASKIPINGIVVEIGSWKGKSTYCIANGLKKGTIYAIDPFNAEGEAGSKEIYLANKGDKPLIEQFQTNILPAKGKNKIETLPGYSNQFINQFQQIDFLFIDGDHSIEGCKFDFQNFSKFIRIGGFLAFHDYYPDRDDLGPTWVIKNLLETSKNFAFFRIYDSLWVAKRIV